LAGAPCGRAAQFIVRDGALARQKVGTAGEEMENRESGQKEKGDGENVADIQKAKRQQSEKYRENGAAETKTNGKSACPHLNIHFTEMRIKFSCSQFFQKNNGAFCEKHQKRREDCPKFHPLPPLEWVG